MVNAQKYIESNFSKDFREIIAIGKNLEGSLDLSKYTNLTKLDIGGNLQLTGLELAPSNVITWISIYETSISDFSFLANTSKLEHLCLPHIDRPKNLRDYQIGKVVWDINSIKDNQLKSKEQEIGKLKTKIYDLENRQEHKQLNDLSIVLFPNQPYNFSALRSEIVCLKIQNLALRSERKQSQLQELSMEAKNQLSADLKSVFELYLTTLKQEDNELNCGKVQAYETILQTKLSAEIIQQVKQLQTEVIQLEKHLANLQQTQNTEQISQVIQLPRKE